MALAAASRRAALAGGARWLFAGWGALLLCAGAPLLLSRAEGSLSLAVLVLLLGGAVWAGTYAVAGMRMALGVAVAAGVLLNLARLPVRESVPHQGREALYRADQSLPVTVQVPGQLAAPALRALLDVRSRAPEPPYVLAADVQGQSLRWRCPRTEGPQWLILPLAQLPVASGHLSVRLRVEGEPARAGDYLEVYERRAEQDPLITLVDASSAPAGDTRCMPA